jgi:acyl carrier protein
VRSIRTDVRYEALLLGDMCREDPAAVREMYDELVALLVGGRIPAPRVRSYPVAEAGEAFSFMAKARHIGRIAITHPAAAGFIRADASYLVSGGLGALGMHVADWLVDRGAKHLVLLGRSAPSATAAVRLERLRAAGARVDVVSADVAASGALERLSEMGLPPLRGVVHAAGIVDDAMIANVDAARMARALRPKADGAQRLASLAAGSDLEFFVFYSSGSALLGSPGQAAYAGANAFLDAYAHLLRAEGRAALSVNWGAWEDGMAAGVDERTARIWAERGIGTLSAARGMAALERALASGQAQAAALAIDWAKFFAGTSAADRPALLTELDTKVPQGAAESATVQRSSPTSLEALRRMPSKQRLKALTDELREHAGSVLGVGPAELDSKAGLTEQGIDSLMAMELATRLGKAFAVSLPSTFVFEHPTLQAIAVYLIDALDLAGEPEDGHATKRGAQPDAASEQDERVAGMSADEASAALLDELDKIGY